MRVVTLYYKGEIEYLLTTSHIMPKRRLISVAGWSPTGSPSYQGVPIVDFALSQAAHGLFSTEPPSIIEINQRLREGRGHDGFFPIS
jgi:hypothetical protein